MATLTFFKLDRVIQVDSPVEGTTVTVQELINEIRGYEDELDFLDYGHIANAFGKQDLGGGESVGITLELINDWRIQFETPGASPTITVFVKGGNLVAINSFSNNPIKPSDFVTVIIAQSTSPSIIQPESDNALLYLVESLVGQNKGVGNYFYWNPISGIDTNDGTSPTKAVKTFAQAQTLATSGNNDTIFCVPGDSSGITTVTERLAITKNNLKVRGPGNNFQLKPTATDLDTITVSADNVDISGLYVETAATGTRDGIVVTGDNCLIKNSWVANIQGNGINVSSSARTEIIECAIENCGLSGTGDGIVNGDSTTRAIISKSIISGCVNGVSYAGTGLADNTMENNLIYLNSNYGVTIGTSVLRTHVRSGHTFNKNTVGNTQDLGTDTFIESQTGGASASEIADAVWDEVISGHVAAGSTGRTLRDAKTRATLASLK